MGTVPRPQSAIDYAAQFSALNYFTTTTTTTTPAPNKTSEELSGPLTLGALLEPYEAVNIANPYSALSYVQNISAVAIADRFRARITTPSFYPFHKVIEYFSDGLPKIKSGHSLLIRQNY